MARSKEIAGPQADQQNRSNAHNASKGGISMVAVAAKDQQAANTESTVQAQFNTVQTKSNDAVAQLAGTKPNTSSVGGKYRIKLSSARESFTYKNREALGLAAVLPEYFPIEKPNIGDVKSGWSTKKMVVSVELKNGAFVLLKDPIPLPDDKKELLVIDSVGFEPDEDELLDNPVSDAKGLTAEKVFMDIKIGTYTKSGEQFELEGANFATRFFKKIEHNLKDLNRDSRNLGYDIDKGNKEQFDEACLDRIKAPKLRRAVIDILQKLAPIRNAMRIAPVTFVGSSLLIAFNLDRPGNSDVKLIDPDHPIVLDAVKDQLARATPRDVMTSDKFTPTPERYEMMGSPLGGGTPMLVPGRDYGDYVRKWQSGFGTGMVNFIKYLTDEMNKLPSE